MRNIIAVTFDSLRADHCGYMGYERDTTPTLDQMANDGIAFERAIAPSSRTNPSMSGILTGEPLVFRDRISEAHHSRRHLARNGTLAERLSEMGYTTGAFCPNAYSSRHYGFDRGFDEFEDFLFTSGLYQKIFQSHLSDSLAVTALRNLRNYFRKQEAFKTWDTYIEDVEQWVENQREPFFLWVFSLDTHFPYITPWKHREWSSLFDIYYYNWLRNKYIDEFNVELSDREHRKLIDIYDDSIRFGDVLLRELRERFSEFNPVYLVFADHGEGLGERGMYGHFYPSLYQENVHVPLVIWGDGILDERVESTYSLLNFPSLVESLTDGNADIEPNDIVVSSEYDGRRDRNLIAVYAGDFKYIIEETETAMTEECYDLNADPGETEDLTETDAEAPSVLRPLAQRRVQHESEVLMIRNQVASLFD